MKAIKVITWHDDGTEHVCPSSSPKNERKWKEEQTAISDKTKHVGCKRRPSPLNPVISRWPTKKKNMLWLKTLSSFHHRSATSTSSKLSLDYGYEGCRRSSALSVPAFVWLIFITLVCSTFFLLKSYSQLSSKILLRCICFGRLRACLQSKRRSHAWSKQGRTSS